MLRDADRLAARAAGGVSETAVAGGADATGYQELLAYEGLGLAPRADWAAQAARFARNGPTAVNLSDGTLSRNPTFCAGLVAIAEVANQVRGRAGTHQKAGVERALAHAASGIAMQHQTVIVLQTREGAAA